MYIKKDYDFEDLKENSWAGATSTLEEIEKADKEEELMGLLEEIFTDTPTETEVNDLLWHDSDYILEMLGVDEEEEEEE